MAFAAVGGKYVGKVFLRVVCAGGLFAFSCSLVSRSEIELSEGPSGVKSPGRSGFSPIRSSEGDA